MASEDEREPNTTCPFSLKVVDYSIDFRPKDSQPYGADIVQGRRVIIEAHARLYGNITKDDLTDLIAYFRFWCSDDGNNEYRNDKIAMLLLNISQPFVQDGQLMTDVSWNNSVKLDAVVPHNVTSCNVMAKVLGKNAEWMNATSGCGGKRCTCNVDNITHAVDWSIVTKKVWPLQDYFNYKQLKFNEEQMKLSERQLTNTVWTGRLGIVSTLFAAVVGAIAGGIRQRRIENEKSKKEMKLRNLELKVKIYGEVSSILHSAAWEKQERLFSWAVSSEEDNKKLAEYVKLKLGEDMTTIEKLDGDKTKKVCAGKKFLLLKINVEKHEVNVEIDGKEIDKFIAEESNGKLNIYRQTDIHVEMPKFYKINSIITEYAFVVPKNLREQWFTILNHYETSNTTAGGSVEPADSVTIPRSFLNEWDKEYTQVNNEYDAYGTK